MGALVGAAMTGVGDWVDISIFESMTGHPNQIARRGAYAYLGEDDKRVEPRTAAGSEQYAVGTFRCADGYVNFLPLGPRMWPYIAQMIGQPELTEDPRFLTPQDRIDNRPEIEDIFQSWLDDHTRYEVFAAAQDAGLPAAPVLQPAEIMDDEHFIQRGYFQTIDHPDFGTLRYTGLPFTLSDAPRSDSTPAPKRGPAQPRDADRTPRPVRRADIGAVRAGDHLRCLESRQVSRPTSGGHPRPRAGRDMGRPLLRRASNRPRSRGHQGRGHTAHGEKPHNVKSG